MYTSTACLSIASDKLKEYLKQAQHPILEVANRELSLAVSLMEQHYKLYHSIYWNDSKAWLKKKVKEELNILCFDAYTSILKAGKLLNEYVDLTNNSLENPTLWLRIIECLSHGCWDLKKEQSYKLYRKQLNFHEVLICNN